MNKALMVGYLESWQAGITFRQAAQSGFDAIVMAFGVIEGLSIGVFGGGFAPAPGAAAMKQDIRDAKAAGARQILFSVGGAHNTYRPGDAAAGDLARAVVEYLTEYGFTGIDFDLEIRADAGYLDCLCAAIRDLDASLLITAAPQINQDDHAGNLYLVSIDRCRLYDQAIANGRFDYLFVQGYNNPWPRIGGLGQRHTGFISAAFRNLKQAVPAETMITMGEPANAMTGGFSLFSAPDVDENVYARIAEQYRSIRGDEQFGGAMVWSIGWDAKAGYPFVGTMNSAIFGA